MSALGVDSAPGPAPVPSERGRLYWLLADCGNIVRRGLTHYQRQPVNIAWQLGFPILSVLLYGYVFGSAMTVPGRS